jgi:DNA-binding transcriptional MerR regulator
MATATLRYYERLGIVACDDRKGLRRQYQPEILSTLAMIALCQRAGFNLTEIKALLATGGGAEWKVLAAGKRDELRGKARRLVLLADQSGYVSGFGPRPGAPPDITASRWPRDQRRWRQRRPSR